ncbi:cupin domain-containing protein [Streptomyces sp. NPDC002285]
MATAASPLHLTVLQPGDGTHSDFGKMGVDCKISNTDIGGLLSIIEQPFAVGALAPPHIHSREDVYTIVTKGEMGFHSGDREVVLGVDGYIATPRGEIHTMWNAGTVPAQIVEVLSPGGFEGFLEELAELVAKEQPDRMPDLAARFGLEYVEEKWLPDVIERFNLELPMYFPST